MSKAWIEDLWLTEPRETLPDGSKVKIPVPSSVTKSLAAYMKTPEKAKVPGKFKTARYGHGKRWRVSWWATLPDGSKKRSSKAFSTRADAESFAAAMEDDIRSGRYVDPADADRPFQAVACVLASWRPLWGVVTFCWTSLSVWSLVSVPDGFRRRARAGCVCP